MTDVKETQLQANLIEKDGLFGMEVSSETHKHKNDYLSLSPMNSSASEKTKFITVDVTDNQCGLLKDSDLTCDNFLFSSKTISLNDSEKEKVQNFNDKLFLDKGKVTNTPKSSSEVSPIDITNEKYLKPFQYGWNRVVETDNEGVYYISPGGKKMYCKQALSDILKDGELTPDNFIFVGRPFGVNDPEKEKNQSTNKIEIVESKLATIETSEPVMNINNVASEGDAITSVDPKYLKPFQYGWKRVVMMGNQIHNPSENNRMVYYYLTPQKKFYSKVQLAKFFKDSELLTPDNFIFNCGPLGLNDPEKEIIQKKKKMKIKAYDTELQSISNTNNSALEGMIDHRQMCDDQNKEKEGACEPLGLNNSAISNRSVKNPRFLKPFQFGWKREVIVGKFSGTAIYYSPEGTIIGSKQQLADVLKGTELSPDDFVFYGGLIGLNDPEKEIIRTSNKEIVNSNYLKPFQYGWKREVVRTGDSRKAFYYTPAGKKIFSKSELFAILEGTELTPDNFLFTGKSLRLNDSKKEIIRTISRTSFYKNRTEMAKTKYKYNIGDPKYLKPFQYGWKREVVEGRGKSVYYYSPAGKKIRLKGELVKILEGTELTTDDFVFGHKPLGLNDPEKEIIRKVGEEEQYLKTGKVSEIPKSPVEQESVEVETETPIPSQKSKMTKIPEYSGGVIPIIRNSKYLKPFQYGWKRVIVKVPKWWSKRNPFVYYYRVGERKVCRKTQLAKILKDSELTPDHFIFKVVSLGLNDPEKEIIQWEQANNNMSDPKFLKPFEYGWKREVVGSSSDCGNKYVGYAFYYSPRGKKVYSKQGLPYHLRTNELTADNFVFLGKPIGLKDPQKEIIRKRKKRKMIETSDSELPSISNDNNSAPEGIKTIISSKIVGEEGYLKRRKMSETPESVVDDFPLDDSNDLGTKSSDEEIETEKPVPMDPVTFTPKTENPKFSSLQNVSYIYNTLLQVFRFLQLKDLLRAACVCTMWRDIANHSLLWRTVRIKYERVRSFQNLADCLEKHGTVHLDLRKMLLPSTSEAVGMWREFSIVIEQVRSLRKIELSRCPGWVVEQLALQNKNLEVINAVTTRGESVSFDSLSSLKNLKEFQLTSLGDLTLSSDITPLKKSTMLTRLSLTSIKGLNKMNLGVIAVLVRLESLDLGECVDFPKSFAQDILVKLKNLKKLRLEKGQGKCCTIEILVAVKRMPQLEQLELVNFDIKTGFDVALGDCKNIKKLLIIPVYVSHTATINQIVLEGVLQLQSTLSHFIWGVTLELVRATGLFIDDKEDCIPLQKPAPLIIDKENNVSRTHNSAQLEILPLASLEELLIKSLPTSKVRILKIPFRATWWQGFNYAVDL